MFGVSLRRRGSRGCWTASEEAFKRSWRRTRGSGPAVPDLDAEGGGVIKWFQFRFAHLPCSLQERVQGCWAASEEAFKRSSRRTLGKWTCVRRPGCRRWCSTATRQTGHKTKRSANPECLLCILLVSVLLVSVSPTGEGSRGVGPPPKRHSEGAGDEPGESGPAFADLGCAKWWQARQLCECGEGRGVYTEHGERSNYERLSNYSRSGLCHCVTVSL